MESDIVRTRRLVVHWGKVVEVKANARAENDAGDNDADNEIVKVDAEEADDRVTEARVCTFCSRRQQRAELSPSIELLDSRRVVDHNGLTIHVKQQLRRDQ